MNYSYKCANKDWEFKLIAKLNHKVFADELKQYLVNKNKALIDKFHSENKYFICLKQKKLIAMVAVRKNRPFSLDSKVTNLDNYFPKDAKLGEIRLLSIEKDNRFGAIIVELFKMVRQWAYQENLDIILISGIIKQLALYRRLGFLPFSEPVKNGEVWYQPMYLSKESHIYMPAKSLTGLKLDNSVKQIANFLPGPVAHKDCVREALNSPAVSHRGFDYQLWLNRIKWQLKRIVKIKYLELFMGTGTLANDVIAAQLKQFNGKGIILVNGEFGERLVQSASSFSLDFVTFKATFGNDFDYLKLNNIITQNSQIKWIWFVHLETSVGIVNSLPKIIEIAKPKKIKICIDGISAVGNIATDYSKIYLASTSSGKGLSAYTGISIVFYNHNLKKPKISIPVYLNLYKYKQAGGIPFSGNSNLIHSLYSALENLNIESKIQKINTCYQRIYKELDNTPLQVVKIKGEGAVMINIKLPKKTSSLTFGSIMEQKGYLLHYRSRYLVAKNYLQIGIMTEESCKNINGLIAELTKTYNELYTTSK